MLSALSVCPPSFASAVFVVDRWVSVVVGKGVVFVVVGRSAGVDVGMVVVVGVGGDKVVVTAIVG